MLNLSKSLYIRGLQCTKSLWLKRYNKDVLTPPNEQMKTIFEIGDKVGAKARDLFPGGKKVPFQHITFAEKIALTKKWIKEGVQNIYEATFEFDGVLVMVDILHINDDGSVEIYEVKSSTWNSEKKINKIQKYIEDASIQHYVLKGCGFEIRKTSIVLLNTDYIRGSELELEKLFSKVDVTDNVLALQEDILIHLNIFTNVLEDKINEPDIDIGWHCKHPYECDAFQYCWKIQRNIPEYSVFDIFPLTKNSKALQLYRQGIVEVNEIPNDFEMTENQALAANAWKNHYTNIETDEIKHFLDSLTYPIYHFDFETFQQAIPEFKGTKSFQQIPFQYSLHIEHQNGDIEHKEFLGEEGTDPRAALVNQMLQDIPAGSTVMAFNSRFEEGVIEDLKEVFPMYDDHLTSLMDNIVDLAWPFKMKYYYLPEMKGKFSIKIILPLLAPDMVKAYQDLKFIHNGGDAMNTFPKLVDMDDDEKAEYRTALLEYCKLDTWAMVRVLDKLRRS